MYNYSQVPCMSLKIQAKFYDMDGCIIRDNTPLSEPGVTHLSYNLHQWHPPTETREAYWGKPSILWIDIAYKGWTPPLVQFIDFIQSHYRLVGKEITREKAEEQLYELGRD